MDKENWNISVSNRRHLFTLLTTRSQIIVFTEIFNLMVDSHWCNDLKHRELVIANLSKSDKNINMSRYMAIFKQIVDAGILISIKKGEYRINKLLITKE